MEDEVEDENEVNWDRYGQCEGRKYFLSLRKHRMYQQKLLVPNCRVTCRLWAKIASPAHLSSQKRGFWVETACPRIESTKQ